MKAIAPLLADGIDVPLVFLFGVAVLVPLMAFQVGVEGAILARLWRLSFRELARGVFLANCWSLAAGIPVKIFNGWLYYWLLPTDLAGFFARYPYTVMLGTGIYFLVTWRVEARYLLKWLAPPEARPVFRARVWSSVLVANLATYAVLAPVHYFATRPTHNIQEFTANTAWARQPPTPLLYIDSATQHLKSTDTEGSPPETVVPLPVVDYQVAADLKLCLFRAPDGNSYLYRRDTGVAALVWKATERYFMENVAFSPSGRLVAWFQPAVQRVQVADLQSSNRWDMRWVGEPEQVQIAWTTEESQFVIRSRGQRTLMQVTPERTLKEVESSHGVPPAFAPVYGRVSAGRYFSSRDWGPSYDRDELNGLVAWTVPGLGAHLRVYRKNNSTASQVRLAVNPGWLHLSRFAITHPNFLSGGRECLFETRTDIYLLDVERRRVGRVTAGHGYILLDSRYAKGREDPSR